MTLGEPVVGPSRDHRTCDRPPGAVRCRCCASASPRRTWHPPKRVRLLQRIRRCDSACDRSHHGERWRRDVFQFARPRRQPHRRHQRQCRDRRRSQDQRHRQRARRAGIRSNSTSRRRCPPPPIERQNIPVELASMRPACCRAPLSGKAEVRLNGSVVMINGLTGTLGDGAFNGWASVDIASKPLVKLDLDFQRLDIAAAPARAPRRKRFAVPWSNAADRPQRPELCRRSAQNFRRRDQYRRGAMSRLPRSTRRSPAAC